MDEEGILCRKCGCELERIDNIWAVRGNSDRAVREWYSVCAGSTGIATWREAISRNPDYREYHEPMDALSALILDSDLSDDIRITPARKRQLKFLNEREHMGPEVPENEDV